MGYAEHKTDDSRRESLEARYIVSDIWGHTLVDDPFKQLVARDETRPIHTSLDRFAE